MDLTFSFPLDRWLSQRVQHKSEGELYDYVGFRTFGAEEIEEAKNTVELLQDFGVKSAFIYQSHHNSRIAVIADLDELMAFRLMRMPDMLISKPERSREVVEQKTGNMADAEEARRIGIQLTRLPPSPGSTMSRN